MIIHAGDMNALNILPATRSDGRSADTELLAHVSEVV